MPGAALTSKDEQQTGGWYRQEAAGVVDAFDSSAATGLCSAAADRRLADTGPNEIHSERPPAFLSLLAHQLADYMIGLLLVAAVVAGLLGDVVDMIAIVVIVVINAAVGVFQEFRAQRAVAALRELSAPSAKVLRDGNLVTLPASQVVPGDIVRLEAGDVVPADLRLIETTDLGVDESALTGESVPVDKQVKPLDADITQIMDLDNMAFRSTLVTRGRATGITVATGAATEIGRIADLLRDERWTRTPLQTRLASFSRRVAVAVVLICALVFVMGLMQGEPTMLMLLTAISLAVAAVPEALPAVIIVALGLGARRLGERHALVRRLPAVESLGSVDVICADKTGTLTENRMSVGIIVSRGQRYRSLHELPEDDRRAIGPVLALCNDVEASGDSMKGDPTEVALLRAAVDGGIDTAALRVEMPRIGERPFQSEQRYMATLHADGDRRVAMVKGAPERVIEGSVAGTSGADMAAADALARQGYRVLALARREDADAAGLDGGWTFLGLIGLIDPPRPGVAQAIARCRSAGIRPVMITGDHPATARAIATEIGIDADAAACITGNELAALDDEGLRARIESLRVFARVDPEQKIRIVDALHARGHLVAMTGDGVNDAPALKKATIGIAMGQRGTEVAREAAEIVLLDDSFSTIVTAVQEGRRIFDDIRKFIRYTMTSNTGEIWVLVAAPFFGLPIPLLPLHILWINLVTDGLPGLALSAEPAEKDVMMRPPRPAGEGIFTRPMVGHIFWVGIAIGALTLGTQALAIAREIPHWQTMAFTVLVFAQLFHSLAIRSERYSLASIGILGNRMLLAAVALTVVAQLLVIYVPALNTIFHTSPLTMPELAACFGAGAVVLLIVEAEKLVRRQSI